MVGGVPEENWAASGWEGVRRDNPGWTWGHHGPLVVSRVWEKLSVKLEVYDAAAVGAVVKSGVVVGAKKFGAQLNIAAGGRGVQKGLAPAKENAPAGRSAASGVVCYGCGKAGHLRRNCRASGGLRPGSRPPFRRWGCGEVGHGISFYPERSLPMTSATGVPAPSAGSGTVGGGIKRSGEYLAGSGFRSRPFGAGSVLGYLVGGAGGVAAAPQGACA